MQWHVCYLWYMCVSQRKPFLVPSNRMSGNITLTATLWNILYGLLTNKQIGIEAPCALPDAMQFVVWSNQLYRPDDLRILCVCVYIYSNLLCALLQKVSIIKTIQLIVCRGTLAVYYENPMWHLNTLWTKCWVFSVKPIGIYANH